MGMNDRALSLRKEPPSRPGLQVGAAYATWFTTEWISTVTVPLAGLYVSGRRLRPAGLG